MFDFSHGPNQQLPIHTERLGLSKFLKPTTKTVNELIYKIFETADNVTEIFETMHSVNDFYYPPVTTTRRICTKYGEIQTGIYFILYTPAPRYYGY